MVSTPAAPLRRKMSTSQWRLAGCSFLFGLLFLVVGRAKIVSRDDVTEVAGPVRHLELKKYWEDTVLYVSIEGREGRFKTEADSPGFAKFHSAVRSGISVRLWIDTSSLELEQPAAIFRAEVAGTQYIDFDETVLSHNRQAGCVMLLGPVFCFLGYWIWDRATRPLPTAEDTAAWTRRIDQIAQKRPWLFAAVNIVCTVRQWGENIPKVGDLFTAFLFFWILPLYMVFIYVTAPSHRWIVAVFCGSYGVSLAALTVAAVAVPNFPGGNEYPALASTMSRLFNAYILLNITYGGVIWLWGTLTHEPELTTQTQPSSSDDAIPR
ncbi:MAG: hypothetical protein GY826_20660 [Fuerstiella sp.]|nr:hypothetical protein [Fuerstiella sp.]